MALNVPEDVTEALASVRSDAAPENFMLAGYEDDDTLKVIACGSEGVAGLKAALPSSDVAYGLLRCQFMVEKVGQVAADTTKFIFVLWRPDAIPLKRKMKIGRYDGQVKKLFSSYHTDMDINDEDEISDEIIHDMLAKITQTADRVTTRKSITMYLGGNKVGWNKTREVVKPDSRNEFKVIKGANIKWTEGADQELAAALAEVRDDASPIRWCLATYVNKDTLTFNSKGEGDVSEMLSHTNETQVSYGLFRVQEQIDKISATRFCFVVHTPDYVPPMAKAMIATHKGAITPLFRPFHEDFHISEPEELTEEIALEKIASKSGTMSHVTERKQEKRKSFFARSFLGGANKGKLSLEFTNKEELSEAIADVRNDATETNWVIAELIGQNHDLKLDFSNSGTGGMDELLDELDPSKIMYGIFRAEQVIDRSTVVRFFLVRWQGADVSMTKAGNAGILVGAASAFFSPYHFNLDGSSRDEITAGYEAQMV
ncbi:Drebrin-like protein [Hondaea fermentalgiana]|uniref:Drebrin-like protein n=1 Tax=Hondaea fermentalgiana TaxID=2315210 RepID=A0A2R5G251_9STRA|nr:Drebrin-like protein [Hondaea fermentalgiana]|eukprot:GBG23808.1 Drebrin-like protein [Hondaea fermentalgiana]